MHIILKYYTDRRIEVHVQLDMVYISNNNIQCILKLNLLKHFNWTEIPDKIVY